MPNKNFTGIYSCGNRMQQHICLRSTTANSGIKTHLMPNTEIKVTLHFNSQPENYSFR